MRAVQRILSIFESFTPQESSLSLHQISERIALPKSTAFRIIQSLQKAGYLVRLDDQQYCLSFRFTRLAGLVASTLGIREVARPIMTVLAERTGETVSLQMANGEERVCIDAVATASPLRSVSQPGEHVPLLSGASSKTLLAHLPPKETARLIARLAVREKRTQAQVQADLAGIRSMGYAVSHGERVLGVSAIAAPIMGADDQVRYCLALAGPTIRVKDKESRFVPLVMQAAAEISSRYGGALQPVAQRA
jgi:DNA-binding IclR family transcriptional regulator